MLQAAWTGCERVAPTLLRQMQSGPYGVARPRITRVDASPPEIADSWPFSTWRVPLSLSTAAAYQLFVGVDIAARSFTAAWGRADHPVSRPLRLAQSPDGYAAVQQALAATGVAPEQTLVVLEATSTYWIPLASAL